MEMVDSAQAGLNMSVQSGVPSRGSCRADVDERASTLVELRGSQAEDGK